MHIPSGSQSFFSARHIGALIRKFLPLERTVVALVKHTEQQIEIQSDIRVVVILFLLV